MVSIIWCFIIMLSSIYALLNGRIQILSECILEAATEAVDLCIYMAGIVCLWSGIMRIAEAAGILKKIEQWMMPFLNFLFPRLSSVKAKQYMATNMAANLLGLGWAATPPGLKAMEELAECNEEREGVASDEMCTFLVLNISSLQLIPITIIGYRSQYGSINPAGITGPAILATAASTIAAIFFCKMITGMLKY